jgi:hypothetical protein
VNVLAPVLGIAVAEVLCLTPNNLTPNDFVARMMIATTMP